MSSFITKISGLLISTGEIKRQRDLFEDVFELQFAAEQSFNKAEARKIFGLSNHQAKTIVLETPERNFNVSLLELSPSSPETIRRNAKNYDSEALKVVDFGTTDFARAVAALEAKDFHLNGEPARYEIPAGRFTEAHTHGPEGVICALIESTGDNIFQFTQKTDRLFTAPISFSSPISDLTAVFEFYENILGLELVFQYEINDTSFQNLVGMSENTRVGGYNFGLSKTTPMIGIIHYGLPPGSFASLRERSVLPNRGLAGIQLETDKIEEIAERCRKNKIEILADLTQAELAPYGSVKTMLTRAPHGVLHQFIETKSVIETKSANPKSKI